MGAVFSSRILDLPPWIALVFCICLVPIIAFGTYKLYILIQTYIQEKRERRKTSHFPGEAKVESAVVPTVAPDKVDPEKTVSVSTVDRKEIGWDTALRQNSLLKMTSLNKQRQSSLDVQKEEVPLKPKASGCCLHEEELLGLGPMPFDITIIEAEREKELEKLQRAPHTPPVARILSVSGRPTQSSTSQ